MQIRDIGIALAIVGFVGGQLFSSLLMNRAYAGIQMAGANFDPNVVASAMVRTFSINITGDIVSLVGVLVFIVGSIRRRGAASKNSIR